MSLLQALREAKVLRTLDDALANTLRRLDPSIPDDVLAAAALASLAFSNVGPNARHGPHQVAQKSTNTRSLDSTI